MPSAAAPDTEHETSEHPSKATSNASQPETTKPITIMLPDDVLKKLKVVAIVRETSVSDLVAEAAAGVVKRELKKALSKLDP
jgi:hypothetical protein